MVGSLKDFGEWVGMVSVYGVCGRWAFSEKRNEANFFLFHNFSWG